MLPSRLLSSRTRVATDLPGNPAPSDEATRAEGGLALHGTASAGVSRRSFASICVILALATAIVMLPRLRSAQFGLLDDGITIQISRLAIEAARTGDTGRLLGLETGRGRFRPVYWLYNTMPYAIFGADARGHFLANAVSLLLTSISVAGIAALATRDTLASGAAGLAYVLSPPVVESYYTLSKPEVPLTLLLTLSVWCWAGARARWEQAPRRSRQLLTASTLPLLLAYFTKETALAMVLVIGLWVGMGLRGFTPSGRTRPDRWYLAANLGCAVLFWMARGATGTAAIAAGEDSRHYVVDGHVMVSALLAHLAWSLRDFPTLLPLLAFSWWARSRQPDTWIVYVPAFWLLAWTAVMLPWHSLCEYYLLPASVGTSLAMGTGLTCVVRAVRAPSPPARTAACAIIVAVLISMPFVLGNMVTTARVQLAVDAANAHLVGFLARTVPAFATVRVNIPAPNEYIDELSAHLKALKGRGDVAVAPANGDRDVRDAGVFVVSPIMRNQPFPTVRMAVSESSTGQALTEFHGRYRGRAHLVYRHAERSPLLTTEIERPLCPLLAHARAFRESLCRAPRLVDTREFAYGWEVYRLDAN